MALTIRADISIKYLTKKSFYIINQVFLSGHLIKINTFVIKKCPVLSIFTNKGLWPNSLLIYTWECQLLDFVSYLPYNDIILSQSAQGIHFQEMFIATGILTDCSYRWLYQVQTLTCDRKNSETRSRVTEDEVWS